ncbi:hypothetical protein P0W64_16600 [Tsukamurella sp. 8F]|uniref:hypothetical protein n=1 Tax=unclassified Tsukamurella TaxID=2633480 RepID=UPI0023BA2C24|nr:MULTISPECIES: hypothetical protein [unclassified Tsukamurella]MDF0531156.1 hypothetical protein [Tsukamurella sp. 8J]MDF0588402.1 hypothetical protein [Tsukamurella sp. 8F]
MSSDPRVDTDGLTSAAADTTSAADYVAEPPALLPPGGDAHSLGTTTHIAARGAALHQAATAAARYAADGGLQLGANAADYASLDDANQQTYIAAAGGGAAAPTPGITALPTSTDTITGIPVPAPVAPTADADPEQFATDLHTGGDGGASLQSWANWADAGHRDATARAATLRRAATTLGTAWTHSDGPAPASHAVHQLADWHDSAADEYRSIGTAVNTALGHYRTAVEQTPHPKTFTAARENIASAQRANMASGGRFTPVVASRVAELGKLRGSAAGADATYAGTVPQATTPIAAPQPVVGGGTKPGTRAHTATKRKPGRHDATGDDTTGDADTTSTGTGDAANTGKGKGAQSALDPSKLSAASSLASSLPSLLGGLVGGAVSLPASAATQAASTAAQVVQGLTGTQGDAGDAGAGDLGDTGDGLGDDTGDAGVGDLGDTGDDAGGGSGDDGDYGDDSGGADTGDGDTGAAGASDLPTGAAVAPGPTQLSGTAGAASTTPTAAPSSSASGGGMPYMPMNAARGAGGDAGQRAPGKDRKAVLRPVPNSARIHAAVDREQIRMRQDEAAKKSTGGGNPGRPRPAATPPRRPASTDRDQ